jgi:hypothetical protein
VHEPQLHAEDSLQPDGQSFQRPGTERTDIIITESMSPVPLRHPTPGLQATEKTSHAAPYAPYLLCSASRRCISQESERPTPFKTLLC